MTATYKTFRLLCRIEDSARFFDVVAISKDAAMADIVAAYGYLELIQWSEQ